VGSPFKCHCYCCNALIQRQCFIVWYFFTLISYGTQVYWLMKHLRFTAFKNSVVSRRLHRPTTIDLWFCMCWSSFLFTIDWFMYRWLRNGTSTWLHYTVVMIG
jgi:hypothetical protein